MSSLFFRLVSRWEENARACEMGLLSMGKTARERSSARLIYFAVRATGLCEVRLCVGVAQTVGELRVLVRGMQGSPA